MVIQNLGRGGKFMVVIVIVIFVIIVAVVVIMVVLVNYCVLPWSSLWSSLRSLE